ncbi:MAG: hypothetical protein AB7V00_06745 [Bacilli bacterium]
MKKFDIIVISIVFLFSIFLYFMYFSSLGRTDDLTVEVYYRNFIVYSTDITDDIDVVVEITSKDNILTVKVGDVVTTYPISSDDEIINIVHITKPLVEMTHANCKNKYCLHMKLRPTYPSPIVCTNGVMVRYVTKEIIIEV